MLFTNTMSRSRSKNEHEFWMFNYIQNSEFAGFRKPFSKEEFLNLHFTQWLHNIALLINKYVVKVFFASMFNCQVLQIHWSVKLYCSNYKRKVINWKSTERSNTVKISLHAGFFSPSLLHERYVNIKIFVIWSGFFCLVFIALRYIHIKWWLKNQLLWAFVRFWKDYFYLIFLFHSNY